MREGGPFFRGKWGRRKVQRILAYFFGGAEKWPAAAEEERKNILPATWQAGIILVRRKPVEKLSGGEKKVGERADFRSN